MPTSVSPRYLLEGAVYALEQCGLLLRDANVLYRNGSYSSAVAVALFAQEELGRWSILLDLRRKVLDGDNVTVKDIQGFLWQSCAQARSWHDELHYEGCDGPWRASRYLLKCQAGERGMEHGEGAT
jgi:hypothetical protein